MFKDDVGAVRPPKGGSSPQGTAVRSGSRPTTSKIAIPTSAPSDPHTLGRAPSGWLR